MDLLIVAPGRAGGALALAAAAAGHRITALVSRSPLRPELADRFPEFSFDTRLPGADMMVVAAPDRAIAEVAVRLAAIDLEVLAAVHLSGFTPLTALSALEERGLQVGSFHPLQSLPTPEDGARALAGSWAAVTASPTLRLHLYDLATSLGMHAFDLADPAKPSYHAAASAASNFVVTALAVAADLFSAAQVPLAAARPLTDQVVANAFGLGPGAALTGPIARGDWETVAGQLAAASAVAPDLGECFLALAAATARVAGTSLPASLTR